MKRVTVTCDACRQEIRDGFQAISVDLTGASRDERAWDLCQGCASEVSGFLTDKRGNPLWRMG